MQFSIFNFQFNYIVIYLIFVTRYGFFLVLAVYRYYLFHKYTYKHYLTVY